MSTDHRTLTKMLQDIGVNHFASPHYECRRLVTDRNIEIDHLTYHHALQFVRRAESAA